jgi:hypothetical protein
MEAIMSLGTILLIILILILIGAPTARKQPRYGRKECDDDSARTQICASA